MSTSPRSTGRESSDRPSDRARGAWRPIVSGQRADGLRRIKHGIKLAAKDTLAAESWLARRLLGAIEAMTDPAVLADAYEYAHLGQTTTFNLDPGLVDASVQGRAPKAYRAVLRFPALTDQQWDALLAAMAGEAIYLARLPARDVPESMDDLWRERGVELLPASSAAFTAECTCRESSPCKHAAAVALLLVERLEQNPLDLFTLYGLPASRLVDRLRQTRAMMTHGVATTHADPMIPETQEVPLALDQCIDDFWRPGPRLFELEQAPPPQHVAHALLRRLGPSPLKGRFPLVGLLASIYDSVSESAIRIRDQAEQIENGEEKHAPQS